MYTIIHYADNNNDEECLYNNYQIFKRVRKNKRKRQLCMSLSVRGQLGFFLDTYSYKSVYTCAWFKVLNLNGPSKIIAYPWKFTFKRNFHFFFFYYLTTSVRYLYTYNEFL